MRFVDQYGHTPSRGMRLEQPCRNLVHQRLEAAAVRIGERNRQLFAERDEKLRHRDPWIEHERDIDIRRLTRQQRANDGGLAGTDLTGQLDEATRLAHAVKQMSQRLRVARTQKQVSRIRRDGKRQLGKTKERLVHEFRSPLSDLAARRRILDGRRSEPHKLRALAPRSPRSPADETRAWWAN